MSDLKDKFEKWQREARDKFEEIDKQLGLTDTIEEGARTVVSSAQWGAERLRSEAEKTELGKKASEVAEDTIKTAEVAAKKAWEASGPLRDAAGGAGEFVGDVAKGAGKAAGEVLGNAGEKAGEVIDEAADSVGRNVKRVSDVVNAGAGWARTFDSAFRSVNKAGEWIVSDPFRAAATGASMMVGAGLGAAFTGFSSHWLFNSALPAWSVKQIADRFNEYIRSREAKIAKGRLTEAEADRIRFERDIARQIGAPLLGAFSFASGVVMMTNVLNPKTITGAPIDWLLGGNPMLEGVWFFGNGLVCFKTSYDFFMIALDGQEDVARMVREVRGLLPAFAAEAGPA
ncbi:MAG TPA: hypothetical protein PKD24_08255 [Pyrinomonadaceae bacterium]|nr:hypothetical protein [Pyrinomonadaceae bacterium]